MTKDVLVSISGLHTDVMQETEEENEAIEVVNPANYYFRNGKHYIVYDEPVEGVSGTIKNKLKITWRAMLSPPRPPALRGGFNAVALTRSGRVGRGVSCRK